MSEEREQKNQIFAQTTIDPRIQQVSSSDKVKSKFGLDLPTEIVPLPSSGLVYPSNSPLYGKEFVEIKAMTAREEDILTNKVFLKNGTVITELIKSCLIDQTINPLDMLTGDRNALMVAIRVTGYGSDYEAETECASCEQKTKQVFDLRFPIQRLQIEPVSEGTNLFAFTLPYCKKVVHFKFMTGKDEQDITTLAERQKKAGIKVEASVTTNLTYCIESIDGITNKADIAAFVKMMPARDSLALRNFIKTQEPGIIMKQEQICPECGHAEEVTMPMGVSFLWPSVSK